MSKWFEIPLHLKCDLFIIFSSIGWASVANLTLVEILPNQIRTLGGSLSFSIMRFFGFVVSLSFHLYTVLVTPKFTWWTFALIMAVSIAFVTLFIPETKERSLEEIQEDFEKGKCVFLFMQFIIMYLCFLGVINDHNVHCLYKENRKLF